MKKLNFKRFICLVIGLFFCFVIAGCPQPDYDKEHLDPDWEIISQVPLDFINPDWEVHTCKKNIKSIAAFEGSFYLGTEGGIVILEEKEGNLQITGKLNSENGLSSNYITCSIPDLNSNLWFGTKNMGIIRLNSAGITCYRNLKKPNANFITDIKTDINGVIWFSTLGGGLYRLDDGKFYRYTVSDDFSQNSFTNLAVKDSGSVYISTVNSGNFKFNLSDGFSKFSDEIINDLEIDQFGNLWEATISGLILRKENGEIQKFDSTHGLNSDYISSLFLYENQLFIGTMGFGINVYNQNQIQPYQNSNHYKNNINSIYFENGKLLAGTEDGLIVFKNATHNKIIPENEPGGNIITSMDFDNDILWLGSFYSGAGYLKDSNWTWFNYPKDLPSNEVNCIRKIKNNIFIGTSSGLLILGKNSRFLINKENGLPGAHVTDIEYDVENDVILVGTNRGLGTFEKGTWRTFNIYSGLHNDSVVCVSVLNNEYWIGTIGGAELYKNGRFIKYDVNNSKLDNNQISDITILNNEIVFGTFGGGISLKQGDSWRTLSLPEGMASEEVNPNSFCIINDTLYFGAGGRGVDIFDGISFTNISWMQGLTSENILCIKEKNGRIYFGTENGLFIKK
ncbi:MAG: hypothetical protein PHV06_09050 [bacterium]|nr:hypothetical protein [bacterium]